MVASALDLRVPEQNYFSDVAEDAWYADGVNAMAAKGFFAYQFSDWAQTSARNLDELGALVGDQQPGDAGTRETAAGLLYALMEATHLIWS